MSVVVDPEEMKVLSTALAEVGTKVPKVEWVNPGNAIFGVMRLVEAFDKFRDSGKERSESTERWCRRVAERVSVCAKLTEDTDELGQVVLSDLESLSGVMYWMMLRDKVE